MVAGRQLSQDLCVSACLLSKGTDRLCVGPFFQGCLYSEQPRKGEMVSPSGEKRAYWPVQKMWSSQAGMLSCHLPLFTSPYGGL